jgi:hypothetical protein
VEGDTDMKKRGKEVDHMTEKEKMGERETGDKKGKEMGKEEKKGERVEMNTEEK